MRYTKLALAAFAAISQINQPVSADAKLKRPEAGEKVSRQDSMVLLRNAIAGQTYCYIDPGPNQHRHWSLYKPDGSFERHDAGSTEIIHGTWRITAKGGGSIWTWRDNNMMKQRWEHRIAHENPTTVDVNGNLIIVDGFSGETYTATRGSC